MNNKKETPGEPIEEKEDPGIKPAGPLKRYLVVLLLAIFFITIIIWKAVEDSISSETSLIFLGIIIAIGLIFRIMRLV